MIWESEFLELQHLVFGIFGSRFLEIYFLDPLFIRVHVLIKKSLRKGVEFFFI